MKSDGATRRVGDGAMKRLSFFCHLLALSPCRPVAPSPYLLIVIRVVAPSLV